jgi:hypothetical protein
VVVVIITPRPLYPREITPVPFDRRLGGPQSRAGQFEEDKNPVLLPEFGPRMYHRRLNRPHVGDLFADRPWAPPSHLYSGYRVSPGVKRPGHRVDQPPPSSAEVKEYFTPSLGLYCLLQGNLYLYRNILYAPSEGEVLVQEMSDIEVEIIRPLAMYWPLQHCLMYKPTATCSSYAISPQCTVYGFRVFFRTALICLVLVAEKQCVFCEVGIEFWIFVREFRASKCRSSNAVIWSRLEPVQK